MNQRFALPLGTEVKLGKYYRSRGGLIIGPMTLDKATSLFTAPHPSKLLWGVLGDTADEQYDLVAEVSVGTAEPAGVVELSASSVCKRVVTRGGATGVVIAWDQTLKIPPLFETFCGDPHPVLVEFNDNAVRSWYNTAGFPANGLPEDQIVRVGDPKPAYAEGDYVIAGQLRLVCRIESGRAVRVRGDGTSFDLSEVSQLASDAAVRGALRSALAYHLRQTVSAFRDAHPKHIRGAKDIEVRGAHSLANSVVQANP